MSTRRLPRVAAGFCGTAMVVSCVIAAVATFNMSNRKNALVSSMDEQPTETVSVTPMTAIAEGSLQDLPARSPLREVRGGEHARLRAYRCQAVSERHRNSGSIASPFTDAQARNAARADRDGECG